MLAFNLTYMYINTALKNKSTNNKKLTFMKKIVNKITRNKM